MHPFPKKPRLTVVIPTYNEAENLGSIAAALLGLSYEFLDLLVVDDNSPDGTGEMAEELSNQHPGRVQVIHRRGKLGLGTAYIQGFQQAIKAGAQAVCQMDADFSHPPEKVLQLLEALQTCDVALGSRYVPGGGVDREWPLWRKSLSAFGNIYARMILRIPIRDATGGFRVWRSNTLAGMPLDRIRSNGYAFQIEMAYVFYRLGYSYKEVPFYFSDRQWGQSKMSFRIQKEAAFRVWRMLYDYRNLENINWPYSIPG